MEEEWNEDILKFNTFRIKTTGSLFRRKWLKLRTKVDLAKT